jgi:hypothetical protein
MLIKKIQKNNIHSMKKKKTKRSLMNLTKTILSHEKYYYALK